MKEFELIKGWASDRNLIEGSSPTAQMIKLYEEFGELANSIARQNEPEFKDSIGDCVVVLTILMAQCNKTIRKGPNMTMPDSINIAILEAGVQIGHLAKSIRTQDGKEEFYVSMTMGVLEHLCEMKKVSFEECVRGAYDEIKDRKGKMVDGIFVKEDDVTKPKKAKK